MKLKKCPEHGYTLKTICGECGKDSKDAHYTFFKMKSFSEMKALKNS